MHADGAPGVVVMAGGDGGGSGDSGGGAPGNSQHRLCFFLKDSGPWEPLTARWEGALVIMLNEDVKRPCGS